tara:strand:- start:1516 stop:2910 length:1395 start_codon:yes stop_codon:yes gene_type:complete
MKKGLGLQANISSFNTTLPQTKHLNFFMGTNPVGYANGGDVRMGVPSSNMNVTSGFLPMALGFDNGGDVSFYTLVTRVIGNYLAKQSGKSPDDPEIISAAENLQQTNPDAVRVIMESEYGSGVSAGAYDSGFPIGGEQKKEPSLPTETVETDIGEMRIPEGFPDEPSILDKSKDVLGNVLDFGTDLGSNVVQELFPPLTGEEIGAGLDTLLKENEAKNLPQVKEDDVKKSEETPVDVKSATVTDGGIADLNQGSSMGEAANALASSTLSKEEEKDVNEKMKNVLNVDDKKDAPSWALPLMSAGFAMMASKSPNFLQALGEAGQEGIKTLSAQKEAEQDRLDAQSARDLQKAQEKYYLGEGRQTASTPMIIGGKYFVRKGDKLEPLLIDGEQANAQITRTEAIEILQKSNPAFVQMDPTEQNKQIDALIQLYNNSDALVNAQVPETKDGGFEILPFISNLFKEFV